MSGFDPTFIYIFLVIFFVSFVMALFSMRDFHVPKEIEKVLSAKKVKGTIVFLKDKVMHYSSESSSS